jgi:S1-C subfamily serine protease
MSLARVSADRVEPLSDGAVLARGLPLRLRLVSDCSGVLTVARERTGRESAGRNIPEHDSIVLASRPFAAGGGMLPIDLGDVSGPVTLRMELRPDDGAPSVTRTMGLSVLHASPGAEGGPAAAIAAADDSAAVPELHFAALDAAPDAALVERLSMRDAGTAERTRGDREVALFRDWAAGVVLVTAEDGIGSGVMIDRAEGRVLTNWHVVQGGSQLGVVFKPARNGDAADQEVYAAEVLRIDQVADLALIRVRRVPDYVPQFTLGSSDQLEVGADVHAIGHPTGELWSYTRGVVSQVRANYEWSAERGEKHHATVIQTQTPINPGNSGGPLLDDRGAVIGLNTFIRADAQGLAFAVSAEDIRAFLDRREDRLLERAEAGPPRSAPESGSNSGPNVMPGPGGGSSPKSEPPRSRRGPNVMSAQPALYSTRVGGRPDLVLADRDGDGRHDTQCLDEDGDSAIDLWLLDGDGDGHYDRAARDRDGDGEPDAWRAIND